MWEISGLPHIYVLTGGKYLTFFTTIVGSWKGIFTYNNALTLVIDILKRWLFSIIVFHGQRFFLSKYRKDVINSWRYEWLGLPEQLPVALIPSQQILPPSTAVKKNHPPSEYRSMSFRRRKLSPPDTRHRFECFCTPSFTAADGGKYI